MWGNERGRLPGVMQVLVAVECETHAHERPVAGVVGCGQIGLKHEADTHGVAAIGCGVDWGAEGVLQLQLVRLDGYDLQDGKLLHQLLGSRRHQTGSAQAQKIIGMRYRQKERKQRRSNRSTSQAAPSR